MMRRALLALAIAALVVPATALGKGPSEAIVNGSGDGGEISFGGNAGPPDSGPLGTQAERGRLLSALAEQAGLYPALFAAQPDPMLRGRPKGDLGRKYTITWTFPGPNNETWKLRQDVYPYAAPAPVTYTQPGQVFAVYDQKTHGGWFQAESALKQTLVDAGLPSTAAGASSGSSDFPAALLTLLTAFLLVATATVLLIRRRARPAAA